jgi:hypothetical protein
MAGVRRLLIKIVEKIMLLTVSDEILRETDWIAVYQSYIEGQMA